MSNEAGQFLDLPIKPVLRHLLKAGCASLLLPGTVPGSAISFDTEVTDFRQSFNPEQSAEPDGKTSFSSELPVKPLPINLPDNQLPPQSGTQSGTKPKACLSCGISQGVRRTDRECARCALRRYVNPPNGKQKLAPGAWERIRAVPALFKNPVKIQPTHSRAALGLLKTFVKEFSIERQTALTEGEIIEWLVAQAEDEDAF